MSAPQAHEDAVVECVERNTSGLTIKSIRPTDSAAYATGDYEQRYRVEVFRTRDDGTSDDGFVLVDAYKADGQWQVDYIRTMI